MKENKLIAEFMGYSSVGDVYVSRKDEFHIDEMQYDISWDWLMPVVQKIEDYLSDNVGKVGYFDDGLISNDIEVRYQAVVEFIKQYNDEQQ